MAGNAKAVVDGRAAVQCAVIPSGNECAMADIGERLDGHHLDALGAADQFDRVSYKTVDHGRRRVGGRLWVSRPVE